jgi:hypothetical protein
VAIVIILYLNNNYDNPIFHNKGVPVFQSPKEAIENELNCKYYIDTIYINNEPVSFFLDTNNQINAFRYDEVYLKKHLWKLGLGNFCDIQNESSIRSGQNESWAISYNAEENNNVLFGLFLYNKDIKFTVNNQTPKTHLFNFNKNKYLLWYIPNVGVHTTAQISISSN